MGLGLKLGLVALIVATVTGLLYWVYESGREAERAKYEQGNVDSGRNANRGDDALGLCSDGLFDFWTQDCKRAP